MIFRQKHFLQDKKLDYSLETSYIDGDKDTNKIEIVNTYMGVCLYPPLSRRKTWEMINLSKLLHIEFGQYSITFHYENKNSVIWGDIRKNMDSLREILYELVQIPQEIL